DHDRDHGRGQPAAAARGRLLVVVEPRQIVVLPAVILAGLRVVIARVGCEHLGARRVGDVVVRIIIILLVVRILLIGLRIAIGARILLAGRRVAAASRIPTLVVLLRLVRLRVVLWVVMLRIVALRIAMLAGGRIGVATGMAVDMAIVLRGAIVGARV